MDLEISKKQIAAFNEAVELTRNRSTKRNAVITKVMGELPTFVFIRVTLERPEDAFDLGRYFEWFSIDE